MMAGLETTGNKHLTGKSKLEKLDFTNPNFKGEKSKYEKKDLKGDYKKIKIKLDTVVSAYEDIAKEYAKLLSCTSNGKDMNTKNGIGKDISRIISKANDRKKIADRKLEKIKTKIDVLEEILNAAEDTASTGTGDIVDNVDDSDAKDDSI